jgi:hypothetical protein
LGRFIISKHNFTHYFDQFPARCRNIAILSRTKTIIGWSCSSTCRWCATCALSATSSSGKSRTMSVCQICSIPKSLKNSLQHLELPAEFQGDASSIFWERVFPRVWDEYKEKWERYRDDSGNPNILSHTNFFVPVRSAEEGKALIAYWNKKWAIKIIIITKIVIQ